MNRKKQLSITLLVLTILLLLTGCQAQKSIIGDPPVSMKTVTQNSNEGLATFEFLLPKGWISGPKYNLAVLACPENAVYKKFKTEQNYLPYTITISNYYYPGLAISEEDKQMYRYLFAGKTSAYEEFMNNRSNFNGKMNTPSSLKDYFNLLLPDDGKSSSVTNKSRIKFQYQHYDGTYGEITEVQYSYVYNGKKTHIIQCYREDIPYSVIGAFDDSVDLSSGKIVLWVANSLKVTEHFAIKDNTIQKED